MVRKIIDDYHSAFFTADFGASSHVLKRAQRVRDYVATKSPGVGGDDYCQTVQQVEVADQRCFKLAPGLSFTSDRKLAQLAGKIHFAETPLRFSTGAKRFELREKPPAE